MVDVSGKPATLRRASAQAIVRLGRRALQAVLAGTIRKGEALGVARIAGIQAAKETPRLLPLCHPLLLTRVRVDLEPLGEDAVCIESEVECSGQTGVEMEAMTAASVAALALYDMCKSVDKGIVIESLRLLRKSGGKSGTWSRGRRR